MPLRVIAVCPGLSQSFRGEVESHFTWMEQLNVDEADVVFVLTHLKVQAGGVYHIRPRFTHLN